MKRRTCVLTFAALVLAGVHPAMSQTRSVAEPFKLGTFEINEQPTIGIVLRDSIIIELNRANRELEKSPLAIKLPMPEDMTDLIARYDYGMRERLYDIVNKIVGENLVTGAQRPPYVHDVGQVRTLPPVRPTTILNAAVNYYGHAGEAGTPEEQQAAAEARKKQKGVPYLFVKPTASVIGDGDDILMPRGRDRVDWETEIGVIIGRPAKYVAVASAKDYIFGYTIHLDMSDRGGRPETPARHGSDWFLGKGHDTFGPTGPFIVPKEFLTDTSDIAQQLWVNGVLMQNGRSSDMINSIGELINWGSSMLTLQPGDMIAAGSPRGTGMSRAHERSEPVFLKPGDKIKATIEGIGTLNHTVKADEAPMAATSPD